MADRLARGLLRAWEGLIVPLAATAGAFVRLEGWKEFNYRHPSDYVREQLDRTGRWLQDYALLHRAMEQHPSLRAALLGSDGKPALGQMAALAIARVATPDTVAFWIERARAVSVRTLVDDVRRFKAGARSRAGVAQADEEGSDPLAAVGAMDGDSPPDLDFDDTEDGERCRVRIPAVDFVVGVFDELRDLFGAVNGRDTGPAALIEACLGESASSGALPIVIEPGAVPHLPDGMMLTPLHVGKEDAVEERALERATHGWKQLESWNAVALDPRHEPKDMDGAKLRQVAKDLLLRTIEVGLNAGRGGAWDLHWQLVQMTALEDELGRALGDHLDYMQRRDGWRELGFASVAHYASERLGIRRSTAIKRSQLARVLRRHRQVRRAYRDGVLGQEKSLLLHRILMRGTPGQETEVAWVRWATKVTVKRIRDQLRLLVRSKLDAAAGPPKLAPWERERAKVIPLAPVECEADIPPGEVIAGRAEADLSGRNESSDQRIIEIFESTDDPIIGEIIESTAEPIAAPSAVESEPGLPSDRTWIESLYRAPGMGLERLERWTNFYVEQRANEPLPSPTVFIDLRLPRGVATDLVNAIAVWHGRVTAAALWLDLEEPKKPLDDPTVLSMLAVKAAYLFTERSRKPPAWVGFLALLENAMRAWDDPHLHERHAAEGTYRKAGWRCMAPGCTARADLQNHHIAFGTGKRIDAPWNLVCLCPFHHQHGIHGGRMSVQGKAPFDLVFRMGRGTRARYYINEREVGAPGTTVRAS